MSTARIVFAAAAISIASIVGIDLIDVLQNVYYQSPPITKYWLGATALVSLFASIGVLSGETLDLNGNLFFNGLEVNHHKNNFIISLVTFCVEG